MTWTLWRAITVDVVRLVLMSTAVLVTVIAFATTVQPLADGKLELGEATRFMVLASVPMLAYALPFAAGFAATLAYHRYAADNEVTAMYSGGISHGRILAPAVAVGLLLAGTLSLLNEQIIPRFLRSMESLVTQDMAEFMIRSMEEGQAARFGSIEIHADSVGRPEPGPGSPYDDQFLLTGVGFVVLDSGGVVERDGTAQRTWVVLVSPDKLTAEWQERIGPDASAAILKFEGAIGVGEGANASTEEFTYGPVRVPNAVRDDPKFLTSGELASLRDNPTRMNFVEAKRLELARGIARVETADQIRRQLRVTRAVRLIDPIGRAVRIGAAGAEADETSLRLEPLASSGVIEVEITETDGDVTRMTAQAGVLTAAAADPSDPLAEAAGSALRLELTGVTTTGLLGGELPEFGAGGLRLERDPLVETRAMDCDGLMERARAMPPRGQPGHQPQVAASASELDRALGKLDREITSKQHERAASAAACMVMVITGAVMALRLASSQPLVVYLWSFFPALATVVLIASGQSATYKQGLVGLPMLWGGVVGLAAYTIVTFRVLSRH